VALDVEHIEDIGGDEPDRIALVQNADLDTVELSSVSFAPGARGLPGRPAPQPAIHRP
jgi:hypothetical protein